MPGGDKQDKKNLGMATGIIAVVGAIAMLTAGALLAGFMSGIDLEKQPDFAAKALLAVGHPGDPSMEWGVSVGPTWLYWMVTLALFGLAGYLGIVARRAWKKNPRHDPNHVINLKGLASRKEILRVAGPARLVERGANLRPSVTEPTPGDFGFRIGVSEGVECYTSVEDSVYILGAPRSGKGLNLVIPMILDAPGAVISTSTRPDALGPTLSRRAQRGPVGVFDPQGLAVGIPSSLRWSPIRGCEQPQTAMIRANALCNDVGKGVTEASFWQQQTVTVVRCLLHAAALAGRPPLDLYRWSLSAPAASEAVQILGHDRRAAPAWDRSLDSIISTEPRQRDGVWAMVSTVFGSLADPQVLAAVSPAPGEEFDPTAFLRQNGTLYLLATASGASATAGLVAALVEDVVETARRLASASPGARLDPPLSLILDEAANYPLPSLAALMSEGGGTGITTVAVLQSRAQARDRWGDNTEQAIWDSAIAKIILGGSSSASDLRDMSQLIGERDQQEVSTSSSMGGKSVSESTRRRDILDPAMIRQIREGYALLLLRSARPIIVELQPWIKRKDAAELQSHRADNEELIRAGAAKKWGTDA